MPFDATRLRDAKVTILPPQPPERGGGPRRIRIEIEIVERRQQSPRRGGAFWFWLLVLLVLAFAAHGQPFHYEHWQGPDGWHGETRQQGSTTDWSAYGPRGEQKHCHRYFVGDEGYTTCR